MTDLYSVLVLALVSASIYAVAASGLVLTYTTSGIFNFAHGTIAMISAFVYWQLRSPDAWGLPVPIALVLTLFVFAPLLGWFIDWAIMRRLHDASAMIRIVVPIGLLVALISLAQIIWPPATVNARLDDFFNGKTVRLGEINVTYHQLIVFAVAVAVAVGLRILLFNTRTGVAMRAVVESRDLAALNGANPNRYSAISWALGSMLAAVAGLLISPLLQLDQVNLTLLVINAFAAAVVGKLRSLPLTFVGAIFLGLFVELARRYQSDLPSWISPDTVPVLMLFAALVVLPQDKAAVFNVARGATRVPQVSTRTAAMAGAGLVVVAWMIPSLMTGNALQTMGFALGLGLIAISMVPLTGYAGLLSLAPMAFAGVGATVMYDMGKTGNPLALLLVIVICGLTGAVVALPAIRLKGLYLALATMAFAFFCEKVVFGPTAARLDSHAYHPLAIGSWEASSQRAQLVVMAVTVALVGVLITALRRSPFGRQLQAMKDSPAAASTLGMSLTRLKVQVFALSAAIAGLGGALLAIWRGQYNAEQFSLLQGTLPGLPLVLMAVVGGIAAVAGAFLGGLLLALMPMVGETYPFLRNLMNLLPGLAGIGLAANPNGAIAQTIDQVTSKWEARRSERPADETLGRRVLDALAPAEPVFAPERLAVGGSADSGALVAVDAEIGLDHGRCDVDPRSA